MADQRPDRAALIDELAHTSHQTWMRQAERDKGTAREELGNLPTERDRERAADTVATLERLGLYGVPTGPGRFALLRHPLVVGGSIAVISAVFASLLIPNITRVSQDRPKELELKRGIIDKVATSTAEALTRGVALGRGDVTGAGGNRQDSIQTAYRKVVGTWRVDAALIDAELLTYFRDQAPQPEWAAFRTAVESFLQLQALTDPAERRATASYLRRYLQSTPATLNARPILYRRVPWDDLVAGRVDPHHWAPTLQTLLLAKRDEIMAGVADGRARGFSHSPWAFG